MADDRRDALPGAVYDEPEDGPTPPGDAGDKWEDLETTAGDPLRRTPSGRILPMAPSAPEPHVAPETAATPTHDEPEDGPTPPGDAGDKWEDMESTTGDPLRRSPSGRILPMAPLAPEPHAAPEPAAAPFAAAMAAEPGKEEFRGWRSALFGFIVLSAAYGASLGFGVNLKIATAVFSLVLLFGCIWLLKRWCD